MSEDRRRGRTSAADRLVVRSLLVAAAACIVLILVVAVFARLKASAQREAMRRAAVELRSNAHTQLI